VTPLEKAILDHLTHYRGPVTMDRIHHWLGFPRRLIEEAVENLRLAGHPVIGDAHGLHLARDSQELAEYIEARRRRLASIYQGNRALRRTLAGLRQQEAGAAQTELWVA
jgi:hypothetical protein